MACRRDSPQSRPHCDLRGSPRCAQLESHACGAIRNLICGRSKAAFDAIFFLFFFFAGRGVFFLTLCLRYSIRKHATLETPERMALIILIPLNWSDCTEFRIDCDWTTSKHTNTDKPNFTGQAAGVKISKIQSGGKQRKLIKFSQFSVRGRWWRCTVLHVMCQLTSSSNKSYCRTVFPLPQVEWEAERCNGHLNMRKKTRGGWSFPWGIHCDAVCCLR